MASLVRSKDWSCTPLGPIEHWPQSLRTTVGLCLASNFPINIIWGAEHTQIYNDGYRVVCGEQHPAVLGMSYPVSWASAWPVIGEPFNMALAGETSFLENQRMFLNRNGYPEESFFTFSTSPIYDETGGIGGLFHPVTETTAAMLGERRTRVVRDLTARLVGADNVETVFDRAAATLAEFAFDLPFVIFYRLEPQDRTDRRYRLAASVGVSSGTAATPDTIELDAMLPWPVAVATRSKVPELVDGLAPMLDAMQCGPYEEPPDAAFVVPISLPGSGLPVAMMIAGASARLPIEDGYRGLYELVGAAVGAALANAQAFEDEQRQAEALAAIDRAKTAFFSNVSHEFRTPLTLMLGPIEEALADGADLPALQRERLQVAHRNALRVLKLVNSLLDFSRIEAGRMTARFEPINLANLTIELTSNFRSACETAGLELVVDCPALDVPVYVDRDMWEKIILNLLSNAFKFTFAGHIAVSLVREEEAVALIVRDTGIGIPAAEIPRIFERFHRVDDRRGRSHEGSGIGLALVESLVHLHDGTIAVSSVVDQGTVFRVTLPLGHAHLAASTVLNDPAEIQATRHAMADIYADEAVRWLPDRLDQNSDDANRPVDEGRTRILLAEDNADMRLYVARILNQAGYHVDIVENGLAALAALRVRAAPDLILTDVMMPGLDGFGLLREIRADRTLNGIVVILLSARAGEEARVEGLAAGADDYIVKPFNARELRARIDGAINLARQRRDAAVREQDLLAEINNERTRTALRDTEQRLEFALEAGRLGSWELDLVARGLTASAIGRENFGIHGSDPRSMYNALLGRIHPEDRDRQRLALSHAIETHSALDIEHRTVWPDGRVTWVEVCGHAVYAEDGTPLRMIGVSLDVTMRKQAEAQRTTLLNELNHRVKNTLAIVQAIARQTQRNARTPTAFMTDLTARISALARAHDLLTDTSWDGAQLADVIDQTLEFYPNNSDGISQVSAHGPAVKLSPNAAVSLNMAFHELGTNAAKYGALSVSSGRVGVEWRIDRMADPPCVDIAWSETGGPPVEMPTQRGFGSRIIENGLADMFGGEVRLDFATGGVRCTMRLPLSVDIMAVAR
ncbi:MAG: ATP-binding protein [Janthinobacterium lividum]